MSNSRTVKKSGLAFHLANRIFCAYHCIHALFVTWPGGGQQLKLYNVLFFLQSTTLQLSCMMLGLTLGGIVEILVLTNVLKNTYWRLIWAIGILMIGLFVLHPQPTPYATDLHRAYGITGIIAALITALALFLGPKQKWLAYGWPVLFIFISFLWCFFYSTPDAMIS